MTSSLPAAPTGILPKTVWFYWDDGWENAPWFVKKNYQSWCSKNPGWTITFLHRGNINQFSSVNDLAVPNREFITVTSKSDLLRIDLLRQFGGVWVDATTLCLSPLDRWILPRIAPSGFFCFRITSKDRQIASWLLASAPGNLLVRRWHEACWQYWSETIFTNQNNVAINRHKLEVDFGQNLADTAQWFAPYTTQHLRIYPYFWFHYLHTRVVDTDADAAALWEKTPSVSGGKPSTFLRVNPLEPPAPEIVEFLADPSLWLLKLDRRSMPEKMPVGSIAERIYMPFADLEFEPINT